MAFTVRWDFWLATFRLTRRIVWQAQYFVTVWPGRKELKVSSFLGAPVPPKLDPKGYFDIERHTFWKTLEAQSPVPPKWDRKGYFDIERHMFSMWKTLETQSHPKPPVPTPVPSPPQVRP